MLQGSPYDRYFSLLRLAASARRAGNDQRADELMARADKIVSRERAVRLGLVRSDEP